MNWLLLKNSLLVSTGATLGSLIIGFFFALWFCGLEQRWRKLALAAAIISLAWPPFLVTNCWLHLLGQTGVWRTWLPLDIYSLGGCMWVLALMTWPITFLFLASAWRRIEPTYFEVEPLLRGVALLRWLMLPMGRIALIQAALLTFVLALNNFAVPAVLQVKVFPAEVWFNFNTTFDYAAAVQMSWPLVAGPICLLLVFGGRKTRWSWRQPAVGAKLLRQQLGPGLFAFSSCIAATAIFFATVIPVIQLCSAAETWTNLLPAFNASRTALFNSILFAGLAATVIAAIAVIVPPAWRAYPLRTLAWLPFLVPGVLLGIVLIWALNRSGLAWVYQSLLVVIVALTMRYFAPGFNVVANALDQTDRNLSDLARLEGATRWQLFRRVELPQILPQLCAAWYVVYLFCLWDVETLVLIIPPGNQTIALRIFNLLHYGYAGQVNALCLLLLLAALLPLVLVYMGKRWWAAFTGHAAGSREPSISSPNQPINRHCVVHLSIPKGLRPKAQGCDEGATLGGMEQVITTPTGLRIAEIIRAAMTQPLWGWLVKWFTSPRVAACASTLGSGTESLWDSTKPNSVRELRCPVLVLTIFALCALTLSSCSNSGNQREGAAPIDSKFFSHVQVIGSRGTGSGQFNKPRSLALDKNDNLFVVDMTGRVQKFSPEGAFILAWQMPQTEKGRPKGMGRDAAGNIIVIEPHYSRVNHFDSNGILKFQWGIHGTNGGNLAFPRAVAVNSRGELYVCEYGITERAQHFTPDAQLIRAFGEAGPGPGQFNRLEGLAIDAQDQLYAADSCNHRIQVFSGDGKFLRTYGMAGAAGNELSYPYDIRVDESGLQFVCEFGNSRIQVFDKNDRSVEIIGGPGSDPGQFANPWSIAFDSKGNLYVADSQNHRVQKFLRKGA